MYWTKSKGKVAQLEDGLNYTNSELAEMKGKLEKKAEKDKLKDLEREVEDLRNRSRRNNLVFYNIPEKAEGQDCVAFIKEFINTHMGLEALCGDAEIERAHRTPTKVPGNNNKKPRPVHVAFVRYTDKVKILSNAAARLKDNPYQGNLIVLEPTSQKRPRSVERPLSLSRNTCKTSLEVNAKFLSLTPLF